MKQINQAEPASVVEDAPAAEANAAAVEVINALRAEVQALKEEVSAVQADLQAKEEAATDALNAVNSPQPTHTPKSLIVRLAGSFLCHTLAVR